MLVLLVGEDVVLAEALVQGGGGDQALVWGWGGWEQLGTRLTYSGSQLGELGAEGVLHDQSGDDDGDDDGDGDVVIMEGDEYSPCLPITCPALLGGCAAHHCPR